MSAKRSVGPQWTKGRYVLSSLCHCENAWPYVFSILRLIYCLSAVNSWVLNEAQRVCDVKGGANIVTKPSLKRSRTAKTGNDGRQHVAVAKFESLRVELNHYPDKGDGGGQSNVKKIPKRFRRNGSDRDGEEARESECGHKYWRPHYGSCIVRLCAQERFGQILPKRRSR